MKQFGSKIIGLGLAGVALIQLGSCTPEIPHYSITYAEKRAVLPNGLKLVVIPDKTTPMVQVDVRYEVGSNEDPPGKAGIAHLVEHMMFQHHPLGPDKPPTFQIIPQVAVGFNAYTTFDKTHYYMLAPKEDLPTLLRIEAFRMGAACQGIPEAEFEREREVVRNEIRQRGGTAEGLVPDLLLQAVYPKGHPYSHGTGGDDSQLSSITFKDVCDFMEGYYVPRRATVIVTGNVDHEEVGRMVALNFGNLKDKPPAPRLKVAPIQPSYKRVEQTLDVERTQVHVMWPLPPDMSDDSAKVGTLFFFAGKLAKQAEDWEFASNVDVWPYGGGLAPVIVFSLELRNSGDVEKALSYVWNATKTASWGMDNYEIDEDTKNLAKADFIQSMEPLASRPETIANVIQYRPDAVKFDSGGEYMTFLLRRFDEMTTDGYSSFVSKTLDKGKATVVVIKASATGKKGDARSKLQYSAKTHEKDAEPLIDPAEANRALPVPQSKSILGSAERYTLGNGMNVILLPYQGLPIVAANLVFRVGAAHESPSSAGIADVAASFIHLPRDSNVGKIGIGANGGAGEDETVFSSRGINIYLPQIIETLERLARIGEYEQESMERWQRRIKDRYKSEQFRQDLAYRQEVAAAIYGPEHPYTTNGTPTPNSIGNVGYDAVTAFQRKHYSAKNATLVVAGNFDVADAKSKISSTFGSWSGGTQDKPVAATQRVRTGPEFVGVAVKAGPQMDVTIAYPAPAGIDDQRAARSILAEMINLRLAKIRTELGSTYGTYAGYSPNIGPSSYNMGGGVDAMRAGESLKAMREKVESLRRGDNFDLDFATARRAVLKRQLAQSTESYALAGRLVNIAAFGLGPDYYDQYTAKVAQVSPAQVKALIAQELDPAKEIVVCKADKATLTKAFQDAGITSVRIVEPK